MAYGLEQYDLDFLTDLSITEIIILQRLSRTQMEINRHHLYLDVLQYFDHRKNISPSSFYNSLRKMEDHNLLTTTKIDGKSKAVQPTGRLTGILDSLNSLLISSSLDMTEIEINFIQEIEKRIKVDTYGETLVIDTSNYLDLQLMNYLDHRAGSISVLELGASGIDYLDNQDIDTVDLREGKIREPNEVYDTAIIPVFLSELPHPEMTNQILLEEIHRVLNPEGILVVTGFSEFEMGDNYFVNQLLEKYNAIMGIRMVSPQQMQDGLGKLDHSKIDVFYYHGMLIGILWK